MSHRQRSATWRWGALAPARRWTAAAGTGAVLLLLCGAPGAAAEKALEEDACPVVAAAQGVQVMVSKSDDLFLAAPFGAAVPAAQSCVDYGVKESSGFAGMPYPGQLVISAPGLLLGSTGQPPDYPAYAASRHPADEESEVSGQGYSLRSRSSETSSESTARAGVSEDAVDAVSTVASARSTVDPKTKSSAATALSNTQPLTINDVLELGRVRSSATAKVRPDGKLARDSLLTVGRTEVAGQVVEITPDGVRAVGQTAAVPDAAGPADALAAAGVRVRYLAAERTQRGVLSAGIEVIAQQQDPVSFAVYTAHYTFGRSFAAAAAVEDGAGGGVPDVPLGGAGQVAVPPEAGGAAGEPAIGGALDSGRAASGPGPAEEAPGAAPPPDPAVAAPAGLIGNPVEMGLAGLYLVIVFGALAMFAGGTLLRLLGVKSRWTS